MNYGWGRKSSAVSRNSGQTHSSDDRETSPGSSKTHGNEHGTARKAPESLSIARPGLDYPVGRLH